jgi:cell wall-associated NlpC family hydrolase
VDTTWLRNAVSSTSPDVLAVALQYVTGAPTVRGADGRVLSSDAAYGPLQADGTRAEGSDFNDYLQVPWSYGSQVDQPETDQVGAVDCSGFTRLVFGWRAGLPLTLDPDGVRLPRRAVQMLKSAPGIVTVPDSGARPASTGALSPGDLVFFDANTDDGTAVDHVGIYLGTDDRGAPRFVSSRKTANGPTLGDLGGRSTLTGTGLYATAWRAARRL